MQGDSSLIEKKMIFTSVGNTAFDSLIEAVDRLTYNDIVIQKANGKYVPKRHKYFEYGDLEPYFRKSEIVITHGGAGNIFKLLKLNKKIIAVANLERTDKHQTDLLSKLSSENNIYWCKNIAELPRDIEKVRKMRFKKHNKPECQIAKKIMEYMGR